jgi:hypothetical protein
MSSTTSRLVLLLLTLVLLPLIVSGTFATLYQFNGADDTTKFCEATQWTLVQTTIANAGKRRFLANRRRLNGSCTGCGPYCVKSGAGCVIRGRRALDETSADAAGTIRGKDAVVASESNNAAHRELGSCDTEMARVHSALDALAPTLTAPCRSLIAFHQRNFTCTATTQDCFVQSFNLWDARTNTIITTGFTSGGWFCGSYRRRAVPVSFEAKANFYIGKMQFVVRGGTNTFWNRTEYTAPYFLNGNYDTGAPGPVYFNAGDYVLTATSEDDARQAKSISFQVRNC